MPAHFFGLFSKQAAETKLITALIMAALPARLFALFFMPDAPLTDTLYHLNIVKYIVQHHALPLAGISGLSDLSLPVPLYHILTAIPFTILPLQFNLETVRIIPFIFSFLQLAISFIILKKLFPKNWPIGFAFVAMQPLLIIFGAVNYLETLASVTVLLCFYIYLRFAETGKNRFLITMPFAIAAMVLSKESATILVPGFFLAFLYELWKKRGKKVSVWATKTAYFALTSAFLSSIWFIVNSKAQGTVASTASTGLTAFLMGLQTLTPMLAFLIPLQFNASFWFFLAQGFQSSPFGISADLAFAAFTIVTFPMLCFLVYGLAKGIARKDKASLLLLLCLALAFFILIVRADRQISSRMLVPVLPLLGIPVCWAFKSIPSMKWKKIALLFFSLTVIYSIALSSLYVLNFHNDYNNHLPLYEFAKGLPNGSAIAIHPNKTRQVEFITGKEAVSFAYFKRLEGKQLEQALEEKGVTHLAATCYKNPWDMDALAQLEEQGFISRVFEDNCSILFKVNW